MIEDERFMEILGLGGQRPQRNHGGSDTRPSGGGGQSSEGDSQHNRQAFSQWAGEGMATAAASSSSSGAPRIKFVGYAANLIHLTNDQLSWRLQICGQQPRQLTLRQSVLFNIFK